jgi:hypothetical protein
MRKLCRKCGEETERHKDGRCSLCAKAYDQARAYTENRIKSKRQSWKKYNDTQGRLLSMWARDLRRAYGITPEEYTEMYVAQKGCCKLCGDRIWLKHKTTHLDHCHKTGKVRGVLCIHCDRGLGGIKDSPQALYRALYYVLTGGRVPAEYQVERIVEGLASYIEMNTLVE